MRFAMPLGKNQIEENCGKFHELSPKCSTCPMGISTRGQIGTIILGKEF